MLAILEHLRKGAEPCGELPKVALRVIRLHGDVWNTVVSQELPYGIRFYVVCVAGLEDDVDDAVRAFSLELSAEEVAFLEEPYVAHDLVGPLARPSEKALAGTVVPQQPGQKNA